MLQPNLDGYHDPSQDLWREVESRTVAALRRGEAIADTAISSETDLREFQDRVTTLVETGIGGTLPNFAAQAGNAPVTSAAAVNPARCTVEAVVRNRVEADTARYFLEKVLLTSPAGTRIPVNLYVPNTPGPHPAVLFLCGHAPAGKAEPTYQEVAGLFAAAGFLVASFDPVGQGERHSYLDARPPIAPGTTEHTYAGIPYWWAGTSLARFFLSDADAVLNYLLHRPDVNGEQIIATGSSGGGMLTTLLMTLHPRLAGAAPATYVSSRREYIRSGARQDAEQILLDAADAGLDHEWLLMAMAPKPVCVLAADWDFFPIEGTLRATSRARRAWELTGNGEKFHLVRVAAPHVYQRDMALAAIEFFARHFEHEIAGDISCYEPPLLAPEQLQVTDSGQIGRDVPSVFPFDFLQQEIKKQARSDRAAAQKPRQTQSPEQGREQARAWLRERVHNHRRPVAPHVRFIPTAGEWHALWRTEENIWGAGVLMPEESGNPSAPVGHIVLLDQGSNDLEHERPLLPPHPESAPSAGGVLALDVRGRGALAPHDRDGLPPANQASSTYRILTDLLWLGDSLAAAQVWDVLRAVDIFAGDEVSLTGRGYGAYLARLAAFCDPRITGLDLNDESVNPDDFWRKREYDTGRGAWHGLIPGLVHRAPWETILAATEPLTRG